MSLLKQGQNKGILLAEMDHILMKMRRICGRNIFRFEMYFHFGLRYLLKYKKPSAVNQKPIILTECKHTY